MMAVCRRILALLLIASAVACFAQESLQGQAMAARPEKVPLNEVSTVEIQSLSAQSLVMPVLCAPDGSILFRLAMPDTGVGDPVSVSRDGKTVIRFGREKINDISNPVPVSVFSDDTSVYMLTRGSSPLGYQINLRTPSGEVQTQQVSKTNMFVARFERDGTYAGSVKLDLSFKPLQLGVFPGGNFLIAGVDSKGEPRLGLVESNGQFQRFVELHGDVHAKDESDASGKNSDPTALPRHTPTQSSEPSLFTAVYTSQITRDGPNLLLFRPLNGPVFSVSSSGEVQVHRLKVQGDYRLFTIRAVRDYWVVELIHGLPHGGGEEFSTYAFDRDSGDPILEYFFPRNLGWGLACIDGNQFMFLMANTQTDHLRVVTLAAASATRMIN
jgi:hypothetical protein